MAGPIAVPQLHVLVVMASPIATGGHDSLAPLDLDREWYHLSQRVRESRSPIHLRRLLPPTLDRIRLALSPAAHAQGRAPHILHFSGHAGPGFLVLEDTLGQPHRVDLDTLLGAWPQSRPLPLMVLNACETAAQARSLARAVVEKGLARAAVGHTRPVLDPEAIAFAARLYAELTHGFPLHQALERARAAVTTHEVVLEGDPDLRFRLPAGEPHIDPGLPPGNLAGHHGQRPFFGRGRELLQLARYLDAVDQDGVVVLITGNPGIGKSRLALAAARRHAWRFQAAAYAEASQTGATLRDLLATLAAALGLSPPEDRLEAELLQALSLRPTLLVLDNLEALPPDHLRRLARFLGRMPRQSAALVTLRPPQPELEALPQARALPLHRGLAFDDALRYAHFLAEQKGVPAEPWHLGDLVRVVDGHPRLLELALAQARRMPWARLVEELRERGNRLDALLDYLYGQAWEALDEAGREAWQALPLFPGGWAPDGVLRAAASGADLEALTRLALADFSPETQGWMWHTTVAEYVRTRAALPEDRARTRLAATLPAWTRWLQDLPPDPRDREAHLVRARPALLRALDGLEAADPEAARGFIEALHRVLPAPDRTLALRDFAAAFYSRAAALARAWRDQPLQAEMRSMEGYALSALGRRKEALEAAREAVDLYRQLARQHPQAFLPDLARSLGAYGYALLQAGRPAEAAAAFREGLEALLPFARALPQAYRGLLQTLLQLYLEACQAAGQKPDEDLMQEVTQALGEVRIEISLEEALRALPREVRGLMAGVALAARGALPEEARRRLQAALEQFAGHAAWGQLARALARLLQGETDPQALARGLNLDDTDALALALTLAATQHDAVLQALLQSLEREEGE